MLEVLGAGPGRTGTLTLRAALQILGFGPCYHMAVTKDLGHAGLWLEAEESVKAGKVFDFNRIFSGEKTPSFKSTVDYPSTTYFPEIYRQNPDAKVVLSVRDSPEVWADSVMATIGSNKLSLALKAAAAISPLMAIQSRFVHATVWDHPRAFNGMKHDRDYLIEYYNRWLQEVKELVPESQLLVFNVKEGWEPLCRFLGVEVPLEPFPRTNERSGWRKFGLRGAVAGFVVAVVGVAALSQWL